MRKAASEAWEVDDLRAIFQADSRRRASLLGVGLEAHGWSSLDERPADLLNRQWGRIRRLVERQSSGFIPMDVESLRPDPAEEMHLKLEKVSSHFRHKAGAVLSDDSALRLLADLYEGGAIEKEDLGLCQQCGPLAKLTAANFCEVGVNIIYITPAGRRFIDKIENA